MVPLLHGNASHKALEVPCGLPTANQLSLCTVGMAAEGCEFDDAADPAGYEDFATALRDQLVNELAGSCGSCSLCNSDAFQLNSCGSSHYMLPHHTNQISITEIWAAEPLQLAVRATQRVLHLTVPLAKFAVQLQRTGYSAWSEDRWQREYYYSMQH